jgi:hypothetical protein
MNDYEVETTQLVNQEGVDTHLKENWERLQERGEVFGALMKIPTGIFIQSLKFFNSTEVNLAGYIWQRDTKGVNDQSMPEPGAAGFILPEQLQTGSDIDPRFLDSPTGFSYSRFNGYIEFKRDAVKGDSSPIVDRLLREATLSGCSPRSLARLLPRIREQRVPAGEAL